MGEKGDGVSEMAKTADHATGVRATCHSPTHSLSDYINITNSIVMF